MCTRQLLLFPAGFLIAVGLAGCPVCPDGEIQVVDDAIPIPAGGSVELEFTWGNELLFGPDDCGGFWYVDEILWGNDTVGTITDCGVYTAPGIEPTAGEVTIWAMEYEDGTCADCCPFASLLLDLES